jgi:N-acetyl-alpha-D-muramate 1-phosphate uridylyltransferase
VLLAGGLGTRVQDLTRDIIPKALLRVGGRPFLDWKIEELVEQGIEEIVILTGHLGSLIFDWVGDGSRFGARVRCVSDGPQLLGTGGAICAELSGLPDAFWVTYGDTLLEAPMEAIEGSFDRDRLDGMMTVIENCDRWEPSNASIHEGLVLAYGKGSPKGTHRYLDYGLLILTHEAFAGFQAGKVFDLADVLESVMSRRRLGAFLVDAPFRSIGTIETHSLTDSFIDGRQR